jgi:tetratricopeptide (TPR) repeat protein
LQLNNNVNYLYQLEVAILDMPKTIEIKANDAALLYYNMGAQLALRVGIRPELNIEEQKSLCQALMHFTLSAHLLTLDDRFELARWPQRAIGLMHFKGHDYPRALEQWTRIMVGNDESDPFHLAVCCFCLGLVYSKCKQYQYAVQFFERALTHTGSLSSVFEAQCHMQIGHSVELQGIETFGRYPPARTHYEKALDFYENRIKPLDEPALALCYAVVGNCHFFESTFTGDANRYYLKAIDLYDAIYQPASPAIFVQARLLIVGTLFNIAVSYYQDLELVKEARECFKRVITYSTEHCPFDSFGLSHRYLGEIYYIRDGEYQKALEHFQAAIHFYEAHSPDDHYELALCNKWLAMTHFKLNAYQLSIDSANKVIDLLLTSQSSISTNTFVGNDLTYLKRATCFQQKDEMASKEQTKNQALSEMYR